MCKSCTLQAVWGCDAYDTGTADAMGFPIWEHAAQVPLLISGEETWRCPRRPIKDNPDDWSKLLFYFALFQKGHLPDEGAIASQSFKSMQILGLIEDTLSECDGTRSQRERDRQARSAGLDQGS